MKPAAPSTTSRSKTSSAGEDPQRWSVYQLMLAAGTVIVVLTWLSASAVLSEHFPGAVLDFAALDASPIEAWLLTLSAVFSVGVVVLSGGAVTIWVALALLVW